MELNALNTVQFPSRGSNGQYQAIAHKFPGNHPGIYAIINQRNLKTYIGSATKLQRRWVQHRHGSTKGVRHFNRYFSRAYAVEPDQFIYEVIEYVEDVNKLVEREQFWIDFFKSNKPLFGYNLKPFAGSNIGFVMPQETKDKLAASKRGHKQSAETIAKRVKSLLGKKHPPRTEEFRKKQSLSHKGKCFMTHEQYIAAAAKRKANGIGIKAVLQFDLSGRFIRRFSSITEAELAFGGRSNIHSVCKGKRNKAFGFMWKYDN